MSEKTPSGSPGDDISELTEGLWEVDVTAGRKNALSCTQVDVYFQLPEGQKVNSGQRVLAMTLRAALTVVALAALLPALRAQKQKRILLGVLEDHPGDYAGQPYYRAVRVVFEKNGNEWRAFPSNCPDENCLNTISSRYPNKVTWTIGLHGRILGSVSTRTYHQFPFYSEVGFQQIMSGEPVPTVGKRSEEFETYEGSPVHRPLIANSEPYFKDPQRWRRATLSPQVIAHLRRLFRQKFPHVGNCKNPDENVWRPWSYHDSNISVTGYTSRDGWRLADLELGPYRCDGVIPRQFDDWWVAVGPNEIGRFIGEGLVFIDSGDYANNHESEVLFQVDGKNLGGYMLFYDHFAKHVSFTFSYH